MKEPLRKLALWAGTEATIEVAIPLTLTVTAWQFAYRFLSEPTPGKPYTDLELAMFLGACVGLTGLAISRFAYVLRKRRPKGMFIGTLVLCTIFLVGLPRGVNAKFVSKCEAIEGQIVTVAPIVPSELRGRATGISSFDSLTEESIACQLGGVPDNPYLVGTLLRPSWDGGLSVPQVLFLILMSFLAPLGFRDKRLRHSQMPQKLFQGLRLSPSAGLKSAEGKPNPTGDDVAVCANPTFWGEACGQIYSSDKQFWDGERCLRCRQTFSNCNRTLSFKVVSLFSDEIDVLNGLERTDTLSWPRGMPMIADARISGQERWVDMGRINVPDLLTVAQTLRIIEEKLKDWSGHETPRISDAAKLAAKRASMVGCWLWYGKVSDRLTHARPTTRSVLALGTTRLRDLVPHGGEDLTIQLDIGLLPVALRIGFRQTFADEERPPQNQNSALDMWIPTSPQKVSKKNQGAWVPRVEGSALRSWLSIQRLRGGDKQGVTTPLPYFPTPKGEAGENENGSPKEIQLPEAGSLDMVRVPLDKRGREPKMERSVGDSISEWHWLEWEQIELLRQQSLVLVEGES